MPIITALGVSGNKPCIIEITVSDELYKKYISEGHPIKNPILASDFKEFLDKFNLPYKDHESSSFVYNIDSFDVVFWKHTKFLDATDIKNALEPCETKTYSDFINWYSEKLKSV